MSAWITGIGVVSPYGTGCPVFWDAVQRGQLALRPVTRFDASPYRNILGGEVPDFNPQGRDRAAAYALAAAQEAVADAGLDLAGKRVGLVLGTNFGGMESAERAFADRAGAVNAVVDLTAYAPATVLRTVRQALPAQGPQAALSLSCASGAAALATALEWIRADRCNAVLAGGFDELSPSAFAGLSALRAISKDTIRPFDVNRGGTIFSEGAAVLVVEAEAQARARGATGVCRLLGRGINNDAFHMTAPDKTGAGIAAVMRMALADAGVAAADIVHINCHGTGTKYNDLIETTAIKAVFADHAKHLVLTANKSLFGHAMGAAGAMEAAVTCLTVKHGLIPPTMGCEDKDPDLDLDVCLDAARSMPVPMAMTNSYGLGGTNASLVLQQL